KNTITGAGTIGDAHLSLVNRSLGIINATGINPLTLTGAGIGNAGLVEATGPGGLIISGMTLANSENLDPSARGTVFAGPASKIALAGATLTGGSVVTALGGTLAIGAGAPSALVNTSVGNNGSITIGA